jgi:hypothetical protein
VKKHLLWAGIVVLSLLLYVLPHRFVVTGSGSMWLKVDRLTGTTWRYQNQQWNKVPSDQSRDLFDASRR